MTKYWLIVDGNNLAWRAHYATKYPFLTTSDGMRTEVTYRFLCDIFHLQRIHATKRIVFCFDKAARRRNLIYKRYKAHRNRHPKGTPEYENYMEVKAQIHDLMYDVLPSIGFKNIFFQIGYEADDMIASVCRSLDKDHKGIIVSQDQDMYQLLSSKVMCWHPTKKEAFKAKHFKKKYGIKPHQWIDVKAIAGCSSDNVKGIEGVGELTALRYLRRELMPSSKAYKSITSREGQKIIQRNIRLVSLPFEGTKEVKLRDDRISRDGWMEITRKLEIETLKRELEEL